MFKKTEEFKKWANDLSRTEALEKVVFPGNVALIEVYKEKTNEDNAKVDMIIGRRADGTFEKKSKKLDTLIRPVAKVLALGNDVGDSFKDLQVGSIVTIPDSVRNTVPNPEYLNLLQLQRGNAEPKIPAGMTKSVTAFSKIWSDWMFQINKLEEVTPLDTVTFLVFLNSQTVQSIIQEV